MNELSVVNNAFSVITRSSLSAKLSMISQFTSVVEVLSLQLRDSATRFLKEPHDQQLPQSLRVFHKRGRSHRTFAILCRTLAGDYHWTFWYILFSIKIEKSSRRLCLWLILYNMFIKIFMTKNVTRVSNHLKIWHSMSIFKQRSIKYFLWNYKSKILF